MPTLWSANQGRSSGGVGGAEQSSRGDGSGGQARTATGVSADLRSVETAVEEMTQAMRDAEDRLLGNIVKQIFLLSSRSREEFARVVARALSTLDTTSTTE